MKRRQRSSSIPQLSLLAAALLAALSAYRPASADDAPNIVVIVADDLGYADLSYNGAADIETPNIDQLARDGVTFSNGYAPYPTCSPSRAGLMTGRYPSRFAMEANLAYAPADVHHGLDVRETLFAVGLQRAGYRTGMIGKWHLGASRPFYPMHRGFHTFYGFLGGGHDYFRVDAAVFAVDEYLAPLSHDHGMTGLSGYLTDRLTDQAIAFASDLERQPFYLHLAYNAPHSPLQAPESIVEKYERVKDSRRRNYLAMVDALDQNIGRLIDALKAAGIWRNTAVFFVGDNGGDERWVDSKPLRGQKGSFHEGGIRVPFLASWPARWPQGETFEHPVIGLDVAATALAIGGGEADPARPLDGVNLDPFLRGEASGPPHEALFWRALWAGKQPRARFAVRSGDAKLVLDDIDAAPALFNLRADPSERVNLAEQLPDLAERLAGLWNEWNAGNSREVVSWMGAYLQHMANAAARFQYSTHERAQVFPAFQIGKAPLPAINPPHPAAPTGLAAKSGNRVIHLSWDAPSDELITGYQYQWRVRGGDGWHGWIEVEHWWDRSSTSIWGLTNGAVYDLQLRSRNSAGWGEPATVAATPKPD